MDHPQSDSLVLSIKIAKEDSDTQNTDSSCSPEREREREKEVRDGDQLTRRGSMRKKADKKDCKKRLEEHGTKKVKEKRLASSNVVKEKEKEKEKGKEKEVVLAKSGEITLEGRLRSPSNEEMVRERKVVSQKSSPNMNENRKLKKQEHHHFKSGDVDPSGPKKPEHFEFAVTPEDGRKGKAKEEETGGPRKLTKALSPSFSRSGKDNKKEALQKNKSAGSSIFKRKKSRPEYDKEKEKKTAEGEKPLTARHTEVKVYDAIDDFPVGIQKQILGMKISKEEMDKNWNLIKKITMFLFKDEFKKQKPMSGKFPLKPQKSTFANSRLIEKGREVIKEQDNLKKVFKTQMMLGSGGFGSVFLGKDLTQAKMRVAVKKVHHIEEKRKLTNFAEIGFLSSCDHPNVVHFFSAWVSSDPKKANEIYILLEYLQGGTLAQAVSSFHFGEVQIAFIGREILRAVQYLHQNNWAHRDLKSANVMLDIDGNVKIIDFGLCVDIADGPVTSMVGSPYWISPEMIKGEPHHLPVDIWSFAVCLLELFLLFPPYHKSPLKCMYMTATEGLAHLIPKSASPEAKQLLEKCLVVDPKGRSTVDELLQLDFFHKPGVEKALANVLREIFMTNSLTSVM